MYRLYMPKAILKSIDTAHYRRKAIQAVNLRKQAVITKCRGLYQCAAKAVSFEKSRVYPCLK